VVNAAAVLDASADASNGRRESSEKTMIDAPGKVLSHKLNASDTGRPRNSITSGCSRVCRSGSICLDPSSTGMVLFLLHTTILQ
jgi:hypothetical protein